MVSGLFWFLGSGSGFDLVSSGVWLGWFRVSSGLGSLVLV